VETTRIGPADLPRLWTPLALVLVLLFVLTSPKHLALLSMDCLEV
jgi:hypothetical protein